MVTLDIVLITVPLKTGGIMVQPKINILEEFWKGYTAKIQAEVSLVNARIAHQGEKGGANERILIDLLTGFLPKQYGVSSGFVIDPEGECSKQTDIILYDNQYNPDLLEYKGGSIVPVDWTYAVIEVKTTLEVDLENAIKNIAKTKSLKYKERWEPTQESKEGGSLGRGVIAHGAKLTSSPIGAIFAYQSGWKDPATIKKNIDKWLKIVDKEFHPNLICCLMDGYLACYMKYPIKPKEDPENIKHALFPVYQPGTGDDLSSFIGIEGGPSTEYGQLFLFNGVYYPVSMYQGSVALADCSRTLLNFLLQLNDFMNRKTLISNLDIRDTYLPKKYRTGKAL
jgi:hypothetical protein